MKNSLPYVAYTAVVLVTIYSIVMTLSAKNNAFHNSAVYTSIRNTTYGIAPISFDIITQPIRKIHSDSIYQDLQTIITGKEPPTNAPALTQYNPFQSSAVSSESGDNPFSNKKDGVYQLVLATSEDTVSLIPKMKVSIEFYSFLQRNYDVKVIMFTNTTVVRKYCEEYGVEVAEKYKKNRYNMPYIASIMRQTVKLAKGEYYGFINNDILFEPSLFPALETLTKYKKHRSIGSFVSIVFNTYNLFSTPKLQFNTTEMYEEFFDRSIREAEGKKRSSSSADLIIFTKEFQRYPMREDIVVGRPKIDSYLMGYTLSNGGQMVFGRFAVRALHQGWTTYKDRVFGHEKEDVNWNNNLVTEKYTTKNCRFSFFGNVDEGNLRIRRTNG